MQTKLPIWIAVGGTPQSVVRAGMLGLPLALAIIGGEPARFAPLFDLYRKAGAQAGHDPASLRTSINVHGFVAESSQEAADTFYAPQAEVMNRIGRERGWPPTSRAQFDAARGPRGALFVGSPAEVTDKILAANEVFGFDRFLIQMAIGVMDHVKLMRRSRCSGPRSLPGSGRQWRIGRHAGHRDWNLNERPKQAAALDGRRSIRSVAGGQPSIR